MVDCFIAKEMHAAESGESFSIALSLACCVPQGASIAYKGQGGERDGFLSKVLGMTN